MHERIVLCAIISVLFGCGGDPAELAGAAGNKAGVKKPKIKEAIEAPKKLSPTTEKTITTKPSPADLSKIIAVEGMEVSVPDSLEAKIDESKHHVDFMIPGTTLNLGGGSCNCSNSEDSFFCVWETISDHKVRCVGKECCTISTNFTDGVGLPTAETTSGMHMRSADKGGFIPEPGFTFQIDPKRPNVAGIADSKGVLQAGGMTCLCAESGGDGADCGFRLGPNNRMDCEGGSCCKAYIFNDVDPLTLGISTVAN